MNQKTQPLGHKPEQPGNQSHTTLLQEQAKLKQEPKEVAGKHKNDGQKDHKGSR